MNPQEQLPEEDNVELEAIAKLNMDANEKLDGVEMNTEASAVKLNEIEQNQEAQIIQTQKIEKALGGNLETMAKASGFIAEVLEFMQGPKGEKGDKGDKGEKGATGKTGAKGAASKVPGPQGPAGKQGLRGKIGPRGLQGPKGEQGPAGKDGKDGRDGKDAKFTAKDRKALAQDVDDQIREELIKSAHSAVASKTVSMNEIQGAGPATAGQVMAKQADGTWAPTTTSGSGDMTKAVYDPTSVAGDAFDMDNMVESATKKVLTNTERTNITNNTTHRTSDGSDHTFIDQDVTSGATPTFGTDNMTDAVNKRFMSDAQETVLNNTSGTNTGDEDTASITALGALMDSELANLAAVKAINQGLTTTSDVTFADITYTTALGTVSALGNLGATEAIDWATATHFTGTLDSNVTITHSNETSGQRITLYLDYSGAQRTITWSHVDKWLGGAAPTAPSGAGETLVVTLQYVGTTCYGSAEIAS